MQICTHTHMLAHITYPCKNKQKWTLHRIVLPQVNIHIKFHSKYLWCSFYPYVTMSNRIDAQVLAFIIPATLDLHRTIANDYWYINIEWECVPIPGKPQHFQNMHKQRSTFYIRTARSYLEAMLKKGQWWVSCTFVCGVPLQEQMRW